jgi:hypothetical protein
MQASTSNFAEHNIGTKRPRSVIESISIGNNFWKTSLKDCGVGKRQNFCWDGSQGPVQSKAAERTGGCRELLNTRRAPSAASLNNFMEYSASDAEASSMLSEECAGFRDVADEVLP